MKKSTIIWIIIILLVIIGAIFIPKNTVVKNDNEMATSTDNSRSMEGSIASEGIPGDNLTLGPSSNTKVGDYLVGYNGMTVYTYSPDTTGVSNCSASCAEQWPPYIVTSIRNLVAESPANGKIETFTRADGSIQVMYNGKPLYFYTGDVKTDDTNGQGVGGVWYVVKP